VVETESAEDYGETDYDLVANLEVNPAETFPEGGGGVTTGKTNARE